MPPKPPLSIVTKGKNPPKAKKPVRRRADWEAVERDYRTGKFSLRELEAQHCVSASAISRKAHAKQWTQDLTAVVKQATNHALLLENATATQQNALERNRQGDSGILNTVLAAAEMNKQVILRHRADITTLRSTTMKAVSMLTARVDAMLVESENPEVKKPDPVGLLLSAQRASQAMSRLQAMERTAFGLDEEDDSASKDLGAAKQNTLTMAARAARLAKLLQDAQQAAAETPPDADARAA